MKRIHFISFLALSAFVILAGFIASPTVGSKDIDTSTASLSDSTSIAEIMLKLGSEHYNSVYPDTTIAGVSIKAGREIVTQGKTLNAVGAVSNRVSNHFTCIACHNTEREDPVLTVSDPEMRLKYTTKNNIPFLPATTFYGAVNRTSYYNGDYIKKYGDLVKDARNSLRSSIQLCATECSQGRFLEPWELNSVLAYLWSLSFKISDLGLSENELNMISESLRNEFSGDSAIALIQSKYLTASPATFVDPPKNRKEGRGLNGRPQIGEKIYKTSCLHCHQYQRFSFFELDSTAMSRNFLEDHLFKYDRYSAYQVVRYGTSPIPGKRAYMPNYTRERLSYQQMADLRAYLLGEDI